METDTLQKRSSLELVRAAGCLTVILYHSFSSPLSSFAGDTTLFQRDVYNIILNLLFWGVPCFFMLSGCLLLNPEKKISLQRLFKHHLPRILAPLLLFGSCFAWMELIFTQHSISLLQPLLALKNTLEGNTWIHMWYLYSLLGVYLLLPVWKTLAEHASPELLRFFVISLFIYNFVLPVISAAGFSPDIELGISSSALCWFFLGYALDRKIINIPRRAAMLGLCLTSGLIIIYTLCAEPFIQYQQLMYKCYALFVAIQAVCIFVLISSADCGSLNRRLRAFLLRLSELSFGIYIIHPVFIHLECRVFKLNPFAFGAPLLVSFLTLCLNLALSWLGVLIMKKLPLLKKII